MKKLLKQIQDKLKKSENEVKATAAAVKVSEEKQLKIMEAIRNKLKADMEKLKKGVVDAQKVAMETAVTATEAAAAAAAAEGAGT